MEPFLEDDMVLERLEISAPTITYEVQHRYVTMVTCININDNDVIEEDTTEELIPDVPMFEPLTDFTDDTSELLFECITNGNKCTRKEGDDVNSDIELLEIVENDKDSVVKNNETSSNVHPLEHVRGDINSSTTEPNESFGNYANSSNIQSNENVAYQTKSPIRQPFKSVENQPNSVSYAEAPEIPNYDTPERPGIPDTPQNELQGLIGNIDETIDNTIPENNDNNDGDTTCLMLVKDEQIESNEDDSSQESDDDEQTNESVKKSVVIGTCVVQIVPKFSPNKSRDSTEQGETYYMISRRHYR